MEEELTSSIPSPFERVLRIRTLVVDSDTTCLGVTASFLNQYNHEVVTAIDPLEALVILRTNQGVFDIVISDLQMTLMNGLEFQNIVTEDFQIPVILMSTNEKRNILMKSVENGAAFYIIKPPSLIDAKNILKFVASRKKDNGENQTNDEEIRLITTNTTSGNDNNSSGSSNSNSNPRKRAKITWSPDLHKKFVEAVQVIGLNRAVPKKIMEYMNVPTLKRENIASHLQKYRLYLKKKAERGGSMKDDNPYAMSYENITYQLGYSWSQDHNYNMSHVNTSQPNAYYPSYGKNNVGTNLVHGETSRRYDNSSQSTNAGMQLMPPAISISNGNEINGYNNSNNNNDGFMGITGQGLTQQGMQYPPAMLNSNFNSVAANGSALPQSNNGMMGQPHPVLFLGQYNPCFNSSSNNNGAPMVMPNPKFNPYGVNVSTLPSFNHGMVQPQPQPQLFSSQGLTQEGAQYPPQMMFNPNFNHLAANGSATSSFNNELMIQPQPQLFSNQNNLGYNNNCNNMFDFNNGFPMSNPIPSARQQFDMMVPSSVDMHPNSTTAQLVDITDLGDVNPIPNIAQPVDLTNFSNNVDQQPNAYDAPNLGMTTLNNDFALVVEPTFPSIDNAENNVSATDEGWPTLLDDILLMSPDRNNVSTENVTDQNDTIGDFGLLGASAQDSLNFNLTCASPPSLDILDEFCKGYDDGDLSSIFQGIDAPNKDKP